MRFDHKKHRTSIRACTIASKCVKIGFSRSKNRIFPFTVDWWRPNPSQITLLAKIVLLRGGNLELCSSVSVYTPRFGVVPSKHHFERMWSKSTEQFSIKTIRKIPDLCSWLTVTDLSERWWQSHEAFWTKVILLKSCFGLVEYHRFWYLSLSWCVSIIRNIERRLERAL